MMKKAISLSVLFAALIPALAPAQEKNMHPVVEIVTTKGTIEVTLDAEKAPVTVANFLSYVKDGFYDRTIFHRVMKGFMIQGGGYSVERVKKETKAPIKNEAGNGLQNLRGTIAMARTNVINSAMSQFYINHRDNDSLNHRNNSQKYYGYAVFGKVTKGMDVVDAIAEIPTKVVSMEFQNMPVEPVMINTIRIKE